MTKELNHDKKREATSAMRGYVYQAYQSVLAWMRLNEDEHLFLESAEDFDVHEEEVVTCTPVKDTSGSGSVTLRSGDVIAAINNYWRHKNLNADRTIRLRFLTTAQIGREKGKPFDDKKGLEYWSAAARDEKHAVTLLKNFLLTLPLDKPLQEFLQTANDVVIRNILIKPISWDTGSKPKDALVADIKNKLITHGVKKGVDSYQSEKTLDTLLSRVADLLCSKGERRLSYADFCRVFDEATMEMMPRGEAAALRSVISQTSALSQFMKTGYLSTLIGSPQILGEPLPLVRGASQRMQLVENMTTILQYQGAILLRGSTGLGKTSLARLISDKIGGQWLWAGFRGLEPVQVADHLRRAAYEISIRNEPINLVLDDLDLGAVARFEKEFLSLAFSFINSNRYVIVTGPLPCASDLLDKLWLNPQCQREIPYLDEKEIAEIILNHGLEDGQRAAQWSRAIWLTTSGHPQLVHARIRNLQSKNWPALEGLGWLQPKDLEIERALARRRLVEDIPSEASRSLAYRLSLLAGYFSRQRAIDISQLPPPAIRPGEAFDALIGPWIEMIRENVYRISPLLQGEGNNVLSPTEIKAVHEGIALNILNQEQVSPGDIGSALMHAFLAKSDSALLSLAKGIILSEHEAWRAIGDSIFWFLEVSLKPGERLYKNNSIVEVALRLAQFRVAAACQKGEQALAIMDRTLELLEQSLPKELIISNKTMAYSIFLNTFEISMPPRRSIFMLSELMELTKSSPQFADILNKFPSSISATAPLAGLSPFQMLFTFEAARISGLNSLGELLSALSDIGSENRSHLLDALDCENQDSSTVDQLIGGAWLRDVKSNQLDVSKALVILRRTVDLSLKWQKKVLTRSAYVAMAVILDEYGKDANAALSILDEADRIVGADNPRLINERAKVLYGRNKLKDAQIMLERALSTQNLPRVERMFSCRLAGMAASKLKDWSSAERLYLMGASEDNQTLELHRMAVGLRADAAYARWMQGRIADALSLYAEVLIALEDIPIDENLKNRHLHAMVRHCIVWLDNSERRVGNSALTEPPPAACSNQEPHESLKDLQIISMSGAWGLLANIDTRCATNLGLAELARQRTKGQLPLIVKLNERIAKYESLWRTGNIKDAIPVNIGMFEAINCQKLFSAGDIALWGPGDISPLPSGFWDKANNRETLFWHLLSVAVYATAQSITESLPIDQWRTDMKSAGIYGPEVDRLLALISGDKEVRDGSLLEDAIQSLSNIRKGSCSPQELYRYHFRLLNALISGDWGHYVENSFCDLVSRQWMHIAEHQKFHLLSPSLNVPALQAKCREDLSGYAKVAAILEAAMLATGVRVSDAGKKLLGSIKTGEKGILANE